MSHGYSSGCIQGLTFSPHAFAKPTFRGLVSIREVFLPLTRAIRGFTANQKWHVGTTPTLTLRVTAFWEESVFALRKAALWQE